MNFQNSSFLVFLTRRANGRIQSTCHVFIYVAESQFGNICYADVVFYTRSVKDGNIALQCISSATVSRSSAEGTSSTRVLWCVFPLPSRKEAASCSLQKLRNRTSLQRV